MEEIVVDILALGVTTEDDTIAGLVVSVIVIASVVVKSEGEGVAVKVSVTGNVVVVATCNVRVHPLNLNDRRSPLSLVRSWCGDVEVAVLARVSPPGPTVTVVQEVPSDCGSEVESVDFRSWHSRCFATESEARNRNDRRIITDELEGLVTTSSREDLSYTESDSEIARSWCREKSIGSDRALLLPH